MAGNILTPLTLWGDFKTDFTPEAELISEYKDGNVVVSRYFIRGKKCADGYVKIYAAVARDVRALVLPSVFVVQDFCDGADETLICNLAKKGYAAFTFDFAGDTGVNGNRSVYPETLDRVNYANAKKGLLKVDGDVRNTCWYEWGVTARYALTFFGAQPYVGKIGAVGIGSAATVLWQLVATTDCFSSAAFIKNVGWTGYVGTHKYGEAKTPNVSDELMKYLAGIDAQSYAPHVKCPTLLLLPANGSDADCDRAGDTVARLKEGVYSAIHYSVGNRFCVNSEAYNDLLLFLKKTVFGDKKNLSLPSAVSLECEIADGALSFVASAESARLKTVNLFVAEEVTDSSLRSWREVVGKTSDENGKYCFTYSPYSMSKSVFAFARAVYDGGFVVCSEILCKKFDAKEVANVYPSNIIYSSRIEKATDVFIAACENASRPFGITMDKDNSVKTEKGPMDILGANCFGGLLTFSVSASRFSPKEDSMLMLDVYSKENAVLTVKLKGKLFGQDADFIARTEVSGGNIWQNVKIERSTFKTAEGRPLKTYEGVYAMEIDVSGAYLINNVLWV